MTACHTLTYRWCVKAGVLGLPRNRRYGAIGYHVSFEKADERASDGYSGRVAARLSEEPNA